MRDSTGGSLNVVSFIEMGVVNACQVDAITPSPDLDILVQQHPHPGGFEGRNKLDEIMISEDPIHGCGQSPEQACGFSQRAIVGSTGAVSIISGDHTEVIFQPAHLFCYHIGKRGVQVQMKIAEVKNAKALEFEGKHALVECVADDLNVSEVSPANEREASQLEKKGKGDHQPVHVLDVKEGAAPPEDLTGMLDLQIEALAKMGVPKTLQEFLVLGASAYLSQVQIHPFFLGLRSYHRKALDPMFKKSHRPVKMPLTVAETCDLSHPFRFGADTVPFSVRAPDLFEPEQEETNRRLKITEDKDATNTSMTEMNMAKSSSRF